MDDRLRSVATRVVTEPNVEPFVPDACSIPAPTTWITPEQFRALADGLIGTDEEALRAALASARIRVRD